MQHRNYGAAGLDKGICMNTTRRLLFWTPRVLCILYAMFLSLFALDVFGQGYGFWGTILALVIHLVPTYIVLIALVIAWRWEWVSSLLFLGLGVFYLLETGGRFSWSTYLLISGPLFLLAILFFGSWIGGRSRRHGQQG
jgi:hypothetical protein